MAYVRKTDTLVTEMRDHVRRMARKAMAPYESGNIDATSPVFDAVVEAVETYAWHKAPHLKSQMPDEWTKQIEDCRVEFQDASGRRLSATHVSFGKKVRIPQHAERYYTYEAKLKPDHCNEQLTQWLAAEATRKQNRDAVEQQYRTIESQLMAFMQGQASLNSALKEMPEIEMYVPEEYMRKYREVAAPRAKKEQQQTRVDELGIDRDVFAAAAIAHRIASAAE